MCWTGLSGLVGNALNNIWITSLPSRSATARAGELLQKAVDQGDPNAMVLLGGMYQRGEGKPQDSARAARLYRDALALPGLTSRHRDIAQAALAAKS